MSHLQAGVITVAVCVLALIALVTLLAGYRRP
jgi:hypothetical protein